MQDGKTPLMKAAHAGNSTVVELLIERKANLGTEAKVTRRPQRTTVLICFPCSQDGRTAFMLAAESADVDTLDKFINNNLHPASVNKVPMQTNIDDYYYDKSVQTSHSNFSASWFWISRWSSVLTILLEGRWCWACPHDAWKQRQPGGAKQCTNIGGDKPVQ